MSNRKGYWDRFKSLFTREVELTKVTIKTGIANAEFVPKKEESIIKLPTDRESHRICSVCGGRGYIESIDADGQTKRMPCPSCDRWSDEAR